MNRRIERVVLLTHGDPAVAAGALRQSLAFLQSHGVAAAAPVAEWEKHAAILSASGGVLRLAGEGDLRGVDLCLVLGGDGTMLRGFHLTRDLDIPVAGVNLGRVGFLTTVLSDRLEEGLAALLAGGFTEHPLLGLRAKLGASVFRAANDVVVGRGDRSDASSLALRINGVTLFEVLCDGVVIGTPAGSSAYSLAAGGPLLGISVDAYVISLVAPHAVGVRPVVAAPDDVLEISNTSRRDDCSVDVDGHRSASLPPGGVVEIRTEPDVASLALLEGTAFIIISETGCSKLKAVLASLAIRNFVLIEDATLEFGDGLTALTGETGAGKTLLTKALGLLMGERAEEGMVGAAGDEALIQAVFDLDAGQVAQLPVDIRDLVGLDGSGEFIITRRLGKSGRNRCYINDASVTLTSMAAVAGTLLSFAGQHEYRRLLDPGYQLAVLDQWAGADTLELAAGFRSTFERAKNSQGRLEQSLRARNGRLRDIELLRFQISELDGARLSLEDEAALQAEQRILSNAEDIQRNLSLAAELLKSDGSVTDVAGLIGQAAGLVGGLSAVGPEVESLATTLREAHYGITELSRELRRYVDNVSVDPARLQAVDERLRLYTDLGRKYGGSTEAAVAHLETSAARLALLEQGEEDLFRLEEEAAASLSVALELGASLTAARRQAVPALEEAIAAQFSGLGMAAAVMTVALDTRAGWEGLRETGADSVEFLLAANPGQPARSLARTASGGELSRVLLGLKCALAGAGGDETLVFDEIDAGIGGRTAVAVAQKLRELSARSQVVVVTHLAHVAALATRHYAIEKTSDAAGAVTRLSLLQGAAVVEELCRMMGGRPDDAEAMAHARDLRDRALESC